MCCDVFEGLSNIDSGSIDLCVTDPPYFLDSLGKDWNANNLKTAKRSHIRNLPVGMKFSRQQTVDLENFYFSVSEEILRVLKPGGFFLSFSSPRLYHSIAWAVNRAGFEVRDMLIWAHSGGQVKQFKMEHFVNSIKKIDNDRKSKLKDAMAGWVTPQPKPTFEPICMAQKPKDGTFVNNMEQYRVGLLRKGIITSTIECSKPDNNERGENNTHLSVKPIEVIKKLIIAFSQEGQIVLDPFMGSGTTALAAILNNRNWIGIDREQEYCDITNHRIKQSRIERILLLESTTPLLKTAGLE